MRSFRPERLVEVGLWLVAAACALWSMLWVLGENGFSRIRYDTVPRWLDPVSLYGAYGQWVSRPVPSVVVSGGDAQRVSHLYDALNAPGTAGSFPANYASLVPENHAYLQGVTTAQRTTYLVLHVLACVALAFIAVVLARLVAASRTDSPFTESNVRRLRVIGLVLLVGSAPLSFAQWLSLHWMVESSSLGDRVDLGGYRLSTLPLWPMLVGAAVLVLADVWRRGVRMADDVEGLV